MKLNWDYFIAKIKKISIGRARWCQCNTGNAIWTKCPSRQFFWPSLPRELWSIFWLLFLMRKDQVKKLPWEWGKFDYYTPRFNINKLLVYAKPRKQESKTNKWKQPSRQPVPAQAAKGGCPPGHPSFLLLGFQEAQSSHKSPPLDAGVSQLLWTLGSYSLDQLRERGSLQLRERGRGEDPFYFSIPWPSTVTWYKIVA